MKPITEMITDIFDSAVQWAAGKPVITLAVTGTTVAVTTPLSQQAACSDSMLMFMLSWVPGMLMAMGIFGGMAFRWWQWFNDRLDKQDEAVVKSEKGAITAQDGGVGVEPPEDKK